MEGCNVYIYNFRFGVYFFDTKDLFTAVAVSGTAATFLTTTFILRIIFDISVSKLSLIISFITSILGKNNLLFRVTRVK